MCPIRPDQLTGPKILNFYFTWCSIVSRQPKAGDYELEGFVIHGVASFRAHNLTSGGARLADWVLAIGRSGYWLPYLDSRQPVPRRLMKITSSGVSLGFLRAERRRGCSFLRRARKQRQ